MRRFVLIALIVVAGHGAQAADLPDLPVLRGGFVDGFASRPADWQGFYIGGHAGVGESDMNFGGATHDIAARLMALTAMESEMQVSQWPLMGKVSSRGHGVGGFAGYNSQWDDVVIGVELNYLHGDFGGSDMDSMTRFFTTSNGFTNFVTYDAGATMAIHDLGTLRARAGYAWGCFLPYLFGGVALGQADIVRTAHIYGTQVNTVAPFQTVPFDNSLTTAQHAHLIYGYSGGLGVDVKLVAGLFLRAEWEYIRFTSAIDTTVNTVRAGLGYKF